MTQQTIAQQLKIKNFPFEIKDDKGNEIYCEDLDGLWVKREYNEKGNIIYWEDSDGFWIKQEYDEKGRKIYLQDSDGFWSKHKYDEKGNEIYYEDSNGVIDLNVKTNKTITMAQQTAVEWFADHLKLVDKNAYNDLIEILEQAKQMEKEQIMNARLDGFKESAEGWNGEYPGWDVKETSIKINNEQYYNETYGK